MTASDIYISHIPTVISSFLSASNPISYICVHVSIVQGQRSLFLQWEPLLSFNHTHKVSKSRIDLSLFGPPPLRT